MYIRIGTFMFNLNDSIHSILFSQQIPEECPHVLATVVSKKGFKNNTCPHRASLTEEVNSKQSICLF